MSNSASGVSPSKDASAPMRGSLFGYTSPDVFNYHQKENDEPLVFTTSIIKNMESNNGDNSRN